MVAERVTAAALAVALVLGSLFMWLGIPLAWIWLLSQVSADYPSVYVLAILGCPSTMALWGLLLVRLNAGYLNAIHAHPAHQRAAWLKSLSGERVRRTERGLLDASMTVSVVLAMAAILIWFFFFAFYHLPSL